MKSNSFFSQKVTTFNCKVTLFCVPRQYERKMKSIIDVCCDNYFLWGRHRLLVTFVSSALIKRALDQAHVVQLLMGCLLYVTARGGGDEARVQVSRDVGFLHRQDVLDATSQLPGGWWQPQGPLRRRLSSHGQQRGQPARSAGPSGQVQLPAEAVQPGAQAAGCQGPGVSGAVTHVLWAEPQARHPGNARSPVQRHQHRRGRVRPDVLRPRLPDSRDRRGGTVLVYLPLVLWGQVQAVPDQENNPHLSVNGRQSLSSNIPCEYTPVQRLIRLWGK